MAFNKKNIKTRLVATVMAVAMVGSFCACGGSSYMGPVDDLMAAVNKKETDPMKFMEIMAPDFSYKEFKAVIDAAKKMSDDVEDSMEEAVEEMEDAYEECDDEFDKWKISFETKDAEKFDKDDLEDAAEFYEDYYKDYLKDSIDEMEDVLKDDDDLEDFAEMLDIDEKDAKSLIKSMVDYANAYEDLKVSAGYEVKGKFILKSGKDTYETDYVKFTVLKINGSWVYCGLTDYESLQFEDDDDNLFGFFFEQLRSSSFYNGSFMGF